MHPPKTGGKTIERQFQIIFRDRLARVSRIFPEISIADVADYGAAFSRQPDRIPHTAEIVTGHFCYGLHDVFGKPPQYFSIIRDPVSRLKSYYNYILNSDPYFIRDFVVENDISFEKLARFGDDFMVPDYPLEFDIMVENGQTRLLAGMTGRLSEPVTNEVHARALANVDAGYIFLAPTEKVTDALIAACLHLGRRPSIRYEAANVAPKDHVGPIPDSLRRYIRDRNRFDVALHETARQSFDDYVNLRAIAGRIAFYKRLINVTGRIYAVAKKARL